MNNKTKFPNSIFASIYTVFLIFIVLSTVKSYGTIPSDSYTLILALVLSIGVHWKLRSRPVAKIHTVFLVLTSINIAASCILFGVTKGNPDFMNFSLVGVHQPLYTLSVFWSVTLLIGILTVFSKRKA
jgi:hypothetical protein